MGVKLYVMQRGVSDIQYEAQSTERVLVTLERELLHSTIEDDRLY